MKRIGRSFVVAFSLVLALTFAVGAQTLDLYSIMPESFAIPFFEAFEAETGIKINFVRHSAGEVLVRLIAEKDNPRVSMVFGGPADTFAAAIGEGVLEPYAPKEVESIPALYRDANNYFTGIALNPIVFLTNTEFLEENGLEAPTSWYDLLDPAYANGLQMADARTSGTGFNRIASIILALGGEDEAFDYMEKMHENVQVYTKSGGGGTVPVATRQASGGVFFLVDSVETVARGYDVVISFPKEGSVVSVEGMALVKNGPNPELAKQFMDWLVTKEAQGIFAKQGIGFLPAREDAEISELIDITDSNFFDLDLEWAGEHRQRLIEKWVDEIVGF